MVLLLKNPSENREEWHRQRVGRIGASQLAEVLGFSTRRTALEAWMKITGREDPLPDTDRMRAGRYMEGGILAWWAEDQGKRLDTNPGLHADDEFAWLIGTPDAVVLDEAGRWAGVVDAKNVDRMFRDAWMTAAPFEYQLQVMIYERILGVRDGWLAPCFGGNELLSFAVPYDGDALRTLLEQGQRWWEAYVEKDVPPPLVPTEGSMRAWRRLHPRDNGQVVTLGPEFMERRARLVELAAEKKAIETEEELLKGYVVEAIGDATYGQLPDGSGWSFKTSTINHKAKEAYSVEQRRLIQVKKAAP